MDVAASNRSVLSWSFQELGFPSPCIDIVLSPPLLTQSPIPYSPSQLRTTSPLPFTISSPIPSLSRPFVPSTSSAQLSQSPQVLSAISIQPAIAQRFALRQQPLAANPASRPPAIRHLRRLAIAVLPNHRVKEQNLQRLLWSIQPAIAQHFALRKQLWSPHWRSLDANRTSRPPAIRHLRGLATAARPNHRANQQNLERWLRPSHQRNLRVQQLQPFPQLLSPSLRPVYQFHHLPHPRSPTFSEPTTCLSWTSWNATSWPMVCTLQRAAN